MIPAIRDFREMVGLAPDCTLQSILEAAAKLFLCHGVKIGGEYRHWKGALYIVESITRDADNWSQLLVNYYDAHDATHRATRKLEEFLGDMDDDRYKGPRFRLIR